MNPGELRHRISLQNIIVNQHPEGYDVETFQDYLRPWSSVKNLYGSEYFAALSARAENTVKFTVRFIKSIDYTMRILFNNKNYQIAFIDNIKHGNKLLELKCIEADYKQCTVFRDDASMGALNRPKKTPRIIGVYQCLIKPKDSIYSLGSPQATISESKALMGTKNMQVQAGDLIQIGEEKYIAGVPTDLLGRHTLVEITLNKDV